MKEATEQPVPSKPDWLSASEHILMDLISAWNGMLNKFMKQGTTDTQKLLKENLLREKEEPKRADN